MKNCDDKALNLPIAIHVVSSVVLSIKRNNTDCYFALTSKIKIFVTRNVKHISARLARFLAINNAH